MASEWLEAKPRLSPLRLTWLLPLVLVAAPRVEAETRTVIDSSVSVDYPSIKVGGDGLGLVAYYDRDNANLKVAHCNDLACTGATVTTLDATGDVGQEASLGIGIDGLGLIAYLNYTDFKLKVAHCNNAACSSATLSTLGDADGAISMAIGADDRGLIAYHDSFNGILVAHCNDVACTTASTAPLANRAMPYTTMAVGTDDRALIGFQDSVTNRMEVAHCNDLACTSATITEVDVADCHTSPTRPLSIAIAPDGFGLIAYTDIDYTLKAAHCLNTACTSSTVTIIKTGLNGQDVGFTIGADGLGLIGYEYQNDLMLAHCNNRLCTRATLVPFDAGGLAGNKSLTLGSNGLPLIGYFIYEGFYEPRLKVTPIDAPLLFDIIFADGFDPLGGP